MKNEEQKNEEGTEILNIECPMLNIEVRKKKKEVSMLWLHLREACSWHSPLTIHACPDEAGVALPELTALNFKNSYIYFRIDSCIVAKTLS